MIDVLLGREDPPIPAQRVDSLMEVANAYYARAKEIEVLILESEREGYITSTSGLSKFRKGELRAAIELFKASFELGSRRITVAQMDVS